MPTETELLIEAIKSLRQEPSILRDYIYPISLSFFSAMFGGIVGYVVFHWQANDLKEREKINAANHWMLVATECFDNLVAIKNNYMENLTPNPIQRITIPYIIGNTPRVSVDVTNLAFLAMRKKTDTNKKSFEQQRLSFDNLIRIRGIFQNYNSLLDMWDQRNELARPIHQKLVSDYSIQGGFADITLDMAVQSIGAVQLAQFSDLTEKVIIQTDRLLRELNQFMFEFPDIVKEKISKKALARYYPVLKYQNTPDVLGKVLKCVPVDENALKKILGQYL